MKTKNQPGDSAPKQNNSGMSKSKNVSTPKKPGNDPDQTPDREVKESPKSNQSKNAPAEKTKIGFKK